MGVVERRKEPLVYTSRSVRHVETSVLRTGMAGVGGAILRSRHNRVRTSVWRKNTSRSARGYYLAGTGVSLDSIVQCFNEGLSPEAILEEFDTLTLTQVFGAITFYLENQPAINAYRVRQKQRFEAMRRASAPLPAGLRERLDAAR